MFAELLKVIVPKSDPSFSICKSARTECYSTEELTWWKDDIECSFQGKDAKTVPESALIIPGRRGVSSRVHIGGFPDGLLFQRLGAEILPVALHLSIDYGGRHRHTPIVTLLPHKLAIHRSRQGGRDTTVDPVDSHDRRHSEIGNLERSLGGDEYIAWFQVEMQEVVLVNMRQARRELR